MPIEPQEGQAFGRFSSLLGKVRGRVMRSVFRTGQWLAARVKKPEQPLITLGTRYGGWVMAQPSPGADRRYALLCGAGEDVSFDIALQKMFGLNCIIIDPTPRAVDHWKTLLERSKAGHATSINGSPTDNYDVSGVDFENISYLPFAVWTKSEEIKFWVPKNPEHVSHSAANIQNTSDYVFVPAMTLADLCPVPADDVELVKLDVEGIGASILSWMIEHEFLPRQILVEFEECIFPTRERDRSLKRQVLRLESVGYELIYFDGAANATFLRKWGHV